MWSCRCSQPIRCRSVYICVRPREALAGIHLKVCHISEHLLAYAHKCFPTCKSATGQLAGFESKVSPFWKLVNQGDMAHESMTKQISYKLYHDDIRNVLKGKSGGLPPEKQLIYPIFYSWMEGEGVNELWIFRFSLANMQA